MGEAIAGMGVPIAVGEPTTGLPVGCTAPDKFDIGLKATPLPTTGFLGGTDECLDPEGLS